MTFHPKNRDCYTVAIRIVSLVSLLGGALAVTSCSSTHRLAINEAEKALAKIGRTIPPDTIRTSDLDSLPAPVKRYLLKSGVVGKERIKTFRGKFAREMKVGGENSKWMKVKVEQYSFIDSTLTRIFYIKSRMFGIVPIVGRDKYENGKGNMLIRLFDLFTVVNQTGPSMDKSALVTFLNDMAMFPMAMLNKKVAWQPVNDTSARAALTDCGNTVSGIFYFNRSDDLVNFETGDRTYDNGRGDVRKAKWRTPFWNYRDCNGVRTPMEGDAVWDFGDRTFPYARFSLKDVGYNNYMLYK